MATHARVSAIEEDPTFYPNHEEDDVPEGTLHQRWSDYLIYALDARFPDYFVAGNICIYWERGNTRDYLGPDAFVAGGRVSEPPPRVYRAWLLPPLFFAAEIGSISNTQAVMEAKRERYAAHLRPLELLQTEPVDEEKGEVLGVEQIHLYRLTDHGYEEMERQPNGRVWSEVLGLEIGVDERDNLRLYLPSGEPVLTYEEEQQARREAELRAQEAEQRAEQEARERAGAEERARGAEKQAQAEARERAAAEQRVAEEQSRREALERELAALRARLGPDA